MADYTIPLQIQQPNMLGAMGNMLGVAQGAQALQTGALQQQRIGINLQSEAQANQERKNVIDAYTNGDPALRPGPDGIIDPIAARTRLQQLAPQTNDQYFQGIQTSNQAAIKTNTDLQSLGSEGLKSLGDYLTPHLKANTNGTFSAKASEVAQAADDWAAAVGSPVAKRLANQFTSSLQSKADDDTAVGQIAKSAILRGQTLATQLDATTPGTSFLSTGQKIKQVVSASRLSGLPLGGQVGTGIQTDVPPTATTMVNGQPQYVGVRPQEAGTAPIAAGPQLGQPELAQVGAGVVGNHFAGLQAEAARASTFEGIARNIQDLAPKAITGTEADRLAFVNGLLAQILPGQTPPDNLKTATDLLQKNMSMLNLQGETATNFKTAITQMAQPHGTMSPTAMKDAAAQLIGQVRMKQSLASYFAPDFNYAQTTGDQSHYMAKLQAINPLTDARAWQFSAMSAEDQKRFRAGLSPQDDAALGQKYKALKALGLIQ